MKNRHHDMNIGKIGIILESFSNSFDHQEGHGKVIGNIDFSGGWRTRELKALYLSRFS